MTRTKITTNQYGRAQNEKSFDCMYDGDLPQAGNLLVSDAVNKFPKRILPGIEFDHLEEIGLNINNVINNEWVGLNLHFYFPLLLAFLLYLYLVCRASNRAYHCVKISFLLCAIKVAFP